MAAYPAKPVHERHLADGRTVVIRPIREEDEPAARRFFAALSGYARHMRFKRPVRAVDDAMLRFLTHIDYDRHMAFVCASGSAGEEELVGEARYIANPDGLSCEFAIVVADAWHHTGVAGLLMEALAAAARERGLKTMEGLVFGENTPMLEFVRALGFETHPDPHDPAIVRAIKAL